MGGITACSARYELEVYLVSAEVRCEWFFKSCSRFRLLEGHPLTDRTLKCSPNPATHRSLRIDDQQRDYERGPWEFRACR